MNTVLAVFIHKNESCSFKHFTAAGGLSVLHLLLIASPDPGVLCVHNVICTVCKDLL